MQSELFTPRWRVIIESNPDNYAPHCTYVDYLTFQEASNSFKKLYVAFGFTYKDIIAQYEPKVIKTTRLDKGAATITLTEI